MERYGSGGGRNGYGKDRDPDRQICFEKFGKDPEFEAKYRVFCDKWDSMDDSDRHLNEVLMDRFGLSDPPLTRAKYIIHEFKRDRILKEGGNKDELLDYFDSLTALERVHEKSMRRKKFERDYIKSLEKKAMKRDKIAKALGEVSDSDETD